MLVVSPKSQLGCRDVSNICGSFHGSLIVKIVKISIQAYELILGFLIFFSPTVGLHSIKGKNYEIIERGQYNLLLMDHGKVSIKTK